MLDKKTVKNILLEIEAVNYNYEEYLQCIINTLYNDNDNDIKYILERDRSYNCLCLYTYSQNDFINWLCCQDIIIEDDDINDLLNNYDIILEYTRQNYINYYIEECLLNFINIKKFRKSLYNNKILLQQVINNISLNINNYTNNKYLVSEYKLNKYLYKELLKIEKGVKNVKLY